MKNDPSGPTNPHEAAVALGLRPNGWPCYTCGARIGPDEGHLIGMLSQSTVLHFCSDECSKLDREESVVAYVDELTGGMSAQAEAKLRALLRRER